MADYQAHIAQAKKNLLLISGINHNLKNSWDWQVTLAYYSAVHLMNAHLAKKANCHFKTHVDVKNALFGTLSPCKIPDDIYTSYVKLENHSRRARYLCHEDVEKTDDNIQYLTFDRHLKKCLGYLDKILIYFKNNYNIDFDKQYINCIEIKGLALTYFEYHS